MLNEEGGGFEMGIQTPTQNRRSLSCRGIKPQGERIDKLRLVICYLCFGNQFVTECD